MYYLAFLLVFVGLTHSQPGNLQFEDCGTKAKIVHVKLDPCDSMPCVVHRGKRSVLSIAAIPHVNSTKLSLDARFKFWGIKYWVPGAEPDLCKSIKCPVVAGQTYEAFQNIQPSKWIPSMTTTVTIKIIADSVEVVCFTTDITLV
ncbi:mite group 2 allergen-like Ixo r 2 [Ornithodoros turicata]|uniref:mite group 2 allergen-like Ixo r 2 n=1 Tax=Ornithodoros turicata TaxID=34597 RepID=UPI00313999D7